MALSQEVLKWFYNVQETLREQFDIDTGNKLDIGKVHLVRAFLRNKEGVKTKVFSYDEKLDKDSEYDVEYAFIPRDGNDTGYYKKNINPVTDQSTFFVEKDANDHYKMNSEMSEKDLMRIYTAAQYGRIYVDSWENNLFALTDSKARFLLVHNDGSSLVLDRPNEHIMDGFDNETLDEYLRDHQNEAELTKKGANDEQLAEMSAYILEKKGVGNSDIVSYNMDTFTFRSVGQISLDDRLNALMLYNQVGWNIMREDGYISMPAFSELQEKTVNEVKGAAYLFTVDDDGELQPLVDVTNAEQLNANYIIKSSNLAAAKGALYIMDSEASTGIYGFTRYEKDDKGDLKANPVSATDLDGLNGDWAETVRLNLETERKHKAEMIQRELKREEEATQKRKETGTKIAYDENFQKKVLKKVYQGMLDKATLSEYLELKRLGQDAFGNSVEFGEFLKSEEYLERVGVYVQFGFIDGNIITEGYKRFCSRLENDNRPATSENLQRAIRQLNNNILEAFKENKEVITELESVLTKVYTNLKEYCETEKGLNDYGKLTEIMSPLSFEGFDEGITEQQRIVLNDGKRIVRMAKNNSLGAEDVIRKFEPWEPENTKGVGKYTPDTNAIVPVVITGDYMTDESYDYYVDSRLEGRIGLTDVNVTITKKSGAAAVAEMLGMENRCARFAKINVMQGGNGTEAVYIQSDGGYTIGSNENQEKYSSVAFSPLKGKEALKELSELSVLNYLISGDSTLDWNTISIRENSKGEIIGASFYDNRFDKAFGMNTEKNSLPSVISSGTAEKILQLDEFDFKYFLGKQNITDEAAVAAWERVVDLRERIQSDRLYFDGEKIERYAEPGHIRIVTDEDWGKVDVDEMIELSLKSGQKNMFTSIGEVPSFVASKRVSGSERNNVYEIDEREVGVVFNELGNYGRKLIDADANEELYANNIEVFRQISEEIAACSRKILDRNLREPENSDNSEELEDVAMDLKRIGRMAADELSKLYNSNSKKLIHIVSGIANLSGELVAHYENRVKTLETDRNQKIAAEQPAAGQQAVEQQAAGQPVAGQPAVGQQAAVGSQNNSFLNRQWDYEDKHKAFLEKKQQDEAAATAEKAALEKAAAESVAVQKEIAEKIAGMTEEQKKKYSFIRDNNRIIMNKFPDKAMSELEMVNRAIAAENVIRKENAERILRQEEEREKIFNSLDKNYPAKKGLFSRVIPYFINEDGTKEAEKENRSLVASMQRHDGKALLYERCIEKIGNLTLNELLLASEEDIYEWSIKNRQVIDLGFITDNIKTEGQALDVEPEMKLFLNRVGKQLEIFRAYKNITVAAESVYYGTMPDNISPEDLLELNSEFMAAAGQRQKEGYDIKVENNADKSFLSYSTEMFEVAQTLNENKKVAEALPADMLNMKLKDLIAVDENENEVTFMEAVEDIAQNGKNAKIKFTRLPQERLQKLDQALNSKEYQTKYKDFDFDADYKNAMKELEAFNHELVYCMDDNRMSLSSVANAESLKVIVPFGDDQYTEVPIMRSETVKAYMSDPVEKDRLIKSPQDDKGRKEGIDTIVTMNHGTAAAIGSKFSIDKNYELLNHVKAGTLFVCPPGEPFENARQLYFRNDGTLALSERILKENRYENITDETKRLLEAAVKKVREDIANRKPTHDATVEKTVMEEIKKSEIRNFDRLRAYKTVIGSFYSGFVANAFDAGASKEEIQNALKDRKSEIISGAALEDLCRQFDVDIRNTDDVRKSRAELREKAIKTYIDIEYDMIEATHLDENLPGVRAMKRDRTMRAFFLDRKPGSREHNEGVCTKFFKEESQENSQEKTDVVNRILESLSKESFDKYAKVMSDSELVENYSDMVCLTNRLMEIQKALTDLTQKGVKYDDNLARKAVNQFNRVGAYINAHKARMTWIMNDNYPEIDESKISDKKIEEFENNPSPALEYDEIENIVIRGISSSRTLGAAMLKEAQIKKIIDPIKSEDERRYARQVYVFDGDGEDYVSGRKADYDFEPGKVLYAASDADAKVHAFRLNSDGLTIEEVTDGEALEKCRNFEEIYKFSPEYLRAKKQLEELYNTMDDVDSFFIKSSPEFSDIKEELLAAVKPETVMTAGRFAETVRKVNSLSAKYLQNKADDEAKGKAVNADRLQAVKKVFMYSGKALYMISSSAENEVKQEEMQQQVVNQAAAEQEKEGNVNAPAGKAKLPDYIKNSEGISGFTPKKKGSANLDIDRINDILLLKGVNVQLKKLPDDEIERRRVNVRALMQIKERIASQKLPELPSDNNRRYGRGYIMNTSLKEGGKEYTDEAVKFNENVSAAFNNPKEHIAELKAWHEQLFERMLEVDMGSYWENVDNDKFIVDNYPNFTRDSELIAQFENMDKFLKDNEIKVDEQLRRKAEAVYKNASCLDVIKTRLTQMENPYYTSVDETSTELLYNQSDETLDMVKASMAEISDGAVDSLTMDSYMGIHNSALRAKKGMKQEAVRNMFATDELNLVSFDRLQVIYLDDPEKNVHRISDMTVEDSQRPMLVFSDEDIPQSYMIPEGNYEKLLQKYPNANNIADFLGTKEILDRRFFNRTGEKPELADIVDFGEAYARSYEKISQADSHFVISSDEFANIKKELDLHRGRAGLGADAMLGSVEKLIILAEAYMSNKEGRNLTAFEKKRLDAVEDVKHMAEEIKNAVRYVKAYDIAVDKNKRTINENQKKELLENTRNRFVKKEIEEQLIALFGADAALAGGVENKKKIAVRLMSGRLEEQDKAVINSAYEALDRKTSPKEVYDICKKAMVYAQEISIHTDGRSIMDGENASKVTALKNICKYSEAMAEAAGEDYNPGLLTSEIIVSSAAYNGLKAEERLVSGMKRDTDEEKKLYQETMEDFMYALALDADFVSHKSGGLNVLGYVDKVNTLLRSADKKNAPDAADSDKFFADSFKAVMRENDIFKNVVNMPDDQLKKYITGNKAFLRTEGIRMLAKVNEKFAEISLREKNANKNVNVNNIDNREAERDIPNEMRHEERKIENINLRRP